MKSFRFVGAVLFVFSVAPRALADDGAVATNPMRDGRVAQAAIVLMSMAAVALSLEMAFRLRRGRQVPSSLADELERECQALRLSEALRLAEGPPHPCALASAVRAGLVRTRRPNATYAAVSQAAEDEGARAMARLDRRITLIGAAVPASALLGVIGTLQALAEGARGLASQGDAIRAADLAAVLARSLGPATWGLVVGLLTCLAVAGLRARLDGLADDLARRVETILEPVGRNS